MRDGNCTSERRQVLGPEYQTPVELIRVHSSDSWASTSRVAEFDSDEQEHPLESGHDAVGKRTQLEVNVGECLTASNVMKGNREASILKGDPGGARL